MTVPRGWPTLASAHGLMAVVLARAGNNAEAARERQLAAKFNTPIVTHDGEGTAPDVCYDLNGAKRHPETLVIFGYIVGLAMAGRQRGRNSRVPSLTGVWRRLT
jgi:hypothetical protein